MDEELVVRARQGDRRAFETLMGADYPRLFRVAHGVLRDRSGAEDATQQAYFDIWRNLRRLRSTSKYEAWSYRILVNACRREARRTPKWIPSDAIPAAREPRSVDALGSVLDRDELERGFRRLTVDQRAVIVLHFLQDMTLEQVATTLGIPRGTVDSRLGRALRTMRTVMGAEARRHESRARQEALR